MALVLSTFEERRDFALAVGYEWRSRYRTELANIQKVLGTGDVDEGRARLAARWPDLLPARESLTADEIAERSRELATVAAIGQAVLFGLMRADVITT